MSLPALPTLPCSLPQGIEPPSYDFLIKIKKYLDEGDKTSALKHAASFYSISYYQKMMQTKVNSGARVSAPPPPHPTHITHPDALAKIVVTLVRAGQLLTPVRS